MRSTDRRTFVEGVGAGAFCAAWGSPWLTRQARAMAREQSSTSSPARTAEDLIHTVAVGDCVRLAVYSPRICPTFRQCFRKHREIVELGGVTPSGSRFAVSHLQRIRSEWPGRDNTKQLEKELAFVLGTLCCIAADRRLTSDQPDEANVYRAAFLLGETCGRGGCAALSADQIQGVLASFWQRTLIRWHTFIPDGRDVETWIERLCDARRQILAEIGLFAERICNPDGGKMTKLIDQVAFYDRQDPVIRLARSLQNGHQDGQLDVGRAIAASLSGSHYARALGTGYRYLQTAGRFFERSAAEEVLKDCLND